MTPKPSRTRSTLGTGLSRFATACRESHRQAARDIRKRWRRCGLWLLFIVWVAMLLLCLTWMSFLDSRPVLELEACLPDGSFTIDPSRFRYLSSSGFFQITLAWGHMNFTQVKTIDISWDIVVGRGGQALIAYVSWRVFAKYVTTSMEVTPITFGTYRTIFLPNGGLFLAILYMIRDFVKRHGLYSRLAMVFMVYTMIFTFLYPTLASAMTGYSANLAAFVNTTEGDLVPFGSFGIAYFIIHDGWRIPGLDGDYIVTAPGKNSGFPGNQPVISSYQAFDTELHRCYFAYNYGGDIGTCDMQLNVSRCKLHTQKSTAVANRHVDALTYGLNGENNTESTFGGQSLGPPVLNISAPSLHISRPMLGISGDIPVHNESWRDEGYFDKMFFVDDLSLLLWGYANETYHLDDIQKNGSCQAVSDYKWGFSCAQLFTMVALHMIWTFGLYSMWLRAYTIMRRRGRGKEDVAGDHKAIFELAAAMREQMTDPISEDGDNLSTLTEAKLRQRVTKDLRGGSISYTAPLLPNEQSGQEWDAKAWVRDHKLSILATFLCTFGAVSSITNRVTDAFFLIPLPLELFLAVYVGSTRGGRIVLFVWSFVIITIPTQTALSIARPKTYFPYFIREN